MCERYSLKDSKDGRHTRKRFFGTVSVNQKLTMKHLKYSLIRTTVNFWKKVQTWLERSY